MQDIPLIKILLTNLNVANSRVFLSIGDRMKDGSSSSVLGQQGGVHHDHAIFELADGSGRDHVAVGADDCEVWL